MMLLKKQLMTIAVMLGIMLMTIACDFTTFFTMFMLDGTSASAPPPVSEQVEVANPYSDDIVYFANLGVSRAEDGAFVLGNVDAPITIIVFADFWCGHCQTYKPTVNRIIDELVSTGEVNLEVRTVAFVGAETTTYAQLVECVATVSGDDALFWVANQLLFDYAINRVSGTDVVRSISNDLGLSQAGLAECLLSATQHQTDTAYSREIAISGVPAVRARFVGDDLATVRVIASQSTGGVDFNLVVNFVRSNR